MRQLKVSPRYLYFTGFFFPVGVKNRLKGVLDVTCINVSLPGFICLPSLAISRKPHSIIHSVSVSHLPPSLPPSLPASPSDPVGALSLGDAAYQGARAGSERWQAPGKFHAKA